MLQPLDALPSSLLDGDVRHGVWAPPRASAFRRGEAHDVAGADFLDRSAFALNAAASGSDDQHLPERVRVPRRARARLKRHGVGRGSRRPQLEKRVDANVPVNQSAGPLADGCDPCTE